MNRRSLCQLQSSNLPQTFVAPVCEASGFSVRSRVFVVFFHLS
jgi:hypothetical protein